MNTLTLSKKPHSLVQGDFEKTLQNVANKNYPILNSDKKFTLEWIPMCKLQPLDTQRHTKSKWAEERLKDLNGLDMFAFGVLFVARDKNDNLWVWDGCGRWTLIGAMGFPNDFVVPCLVYPMEKKEAAKYFSYNQEQGRRKLSREVTFVNAWYSGETSAVELGNLLDYLGLYIQGETDYPVPNPKQPNTYEIAYRAVYEGYNKIAKQDRNVMRQARDMVITALKQGGDVNKVPQDIFWAVLQSLVTWEDLRSGTVNNQFQSYLDAIFNVNKVTTVAKEWKSDVKGISGSVSVSKVLAYNLISAFKVSNKCSEPNSRKLRMKDLGPEFVKKQKADDGDE